MYVNYLYLAIIFLLTFLISYEISKLQLTKKQAGEQGTEKGTEKGIEKGTDARELNFNLNNHINIPGTIMYASGTVNNSSYTTIYTAPAGKKVLLRDFQLVSENQVFNAGVPVYVTGIVSNSSTPELYKCLVLECTNTTTNVIAPLTNYVGAYRTMSILLFPGESFQVQVSANFTQTTGARCKITGIVMDESIPLKTSYAFLGAGSDVTPTQLVQVPSPDNVTRVIVGVSQGLDQLEQVFQFVNDGIPGSTTFSGELFMALTESDPDPFLVASASDTSTTTSRYTINQQRIIDDVKILARKQNASSANGYVIVIYYDLNL